MSNASTSVFLRWPPDLGENAHDDPGDCDFACGGTVTDPTESDSDMAIKSQDLQWQDVWWQYGEPSGFVYSGGPLVIAPPLVAAEEPSVMASHTIDPNTFVCLRCQKTAEEITNDPAAECLLKTDFSSVTRSVVGG